MGKKTIPIERAVQMAFEMHQAGQLEQAERLYVEILRQDPGNIDAIHLLGVLARQGQRPDVAVDLIGRARSRRPDAPLIHFNYADALADLGRIDEAVASYRRALELDPNLFDACNNLSATLFSAGRFVEAEQAARDALKIQPDAPLAMNSLGNALRGQARIDEAIDAYRRALATKADFPEALNNLALSLADRGDFDQAVEALKESIRLRPTAAEAHNSLGTIHVRLGQMPQAITCFETAAKLDPEHIGALTNLGLALKSIGRFDDAMEEIEKAIKLKPDLAAPHYHKAGVLKDQGKLSDALTAIEKACELTPRDSLPHFARGMILRDIGQPDEAIDAIRKSLELYPDRVDALTCLGYALQERGELDEALASLQRAIDLRADPQSHSNVILVMNYHPDVTPRRLYEAARAYAKVHEEPHRAHWPAHRNDRSPDRKLRVGYLSPDFRHHAVSFFSSPLFENHDPSRVELVAYSKHIQSDSITLLQRSRFDQWRDMGACTTEQAAKIIEEDRIDILVELAGHTALNGLPIMARKPAPVQLSMIGYPCTTGLTSIDYRVTDAVCDPPGVAESYNSETLLRMPDIFWCYQPPDPAPPIGPLPADRNGHVTFISVNNFTKVTPHVLRAWATILAQVPGSRMIMQTSALSSRVLKQRIHDIFAQAGVSADRLDLRTWSPFEPYLRLIESCDITLDSFPFNGGTTTCHSLWMGTPIVTLEGKSQAGRMGMSMLRCIGLPELCAPDEAGYIQTAAQLAHDLPRLRGIRSTMRDRLAASPLLDGARYVHHLESSFRQIWRRWCESA